MLKCIYIFSCCLLMLICQNNAAQADSTEISFPYGGEFVLSNDFKYVGSAPYQNLAVDYTGSTSTKRNYTSDVWKVYVRMNEDAQETSELVGVRIFSLPPKWYNRNQGINPTRYYKANIESDEQLLTLLKNTGKIPAAKYACGEFHSIVYDSGGRSISYCVSTASLPVGVGVRSHITQRFLANVTNKSSNAKYASPTLPVSEKSPVPHPTIDNDGLSSGNNVALAYSKTLRKLFYGRSMKSGADAQDQIVSRCTSSDCNSAYVTNDNGCVAFAFGPTGSWGKARGSTLEDARRNALKYCEMYSLDGPCSVVGELCPK